MWPIARAAAPFVGDVWTPVARWSELLPSAPVRFVATRAPYDASIVERGEVPSREGSWHDLFNALVWATFPRAKLALHRRQHRLTRAHLTLRAAGPAADAVAMLDEGGVIVDARGPIVFGHALYAHLSERRRDAWGILVELPVEGLDAADAALAEKLDDDGWLTSPREFPRFDLQKLGSVQARSISASR
jgi:hypothetical protein